MTLRLTINASFIIFTLFIIFIKLGKSASIYIELLSHLMFFWSLVSITYLLIYLFYFNHIKFSIIALLISCITAYPWIKILIPVNHRSDFNGDEVSILQWNIYYKNKSSISKFLAHVKQQPADIILIQEVTPKIVKNLIPLKQEYPYTFISTESHSYGMALFSKLPIIDAQRFNFKNTVNKYTILKFQTLEHKVPFTLVELHAKSPSYSKLLRQQRDDRKHELEEISTVISELNTAHKILIGDLNTTPYSPYFYKLQKMSMLLNGMQGIRIQGTWPSHLPAFLRIPIDHLLVSDKISVIKQLLYQPSGSDHLAIFSSIRLLI